MNVSVKWIKNNESTLSFSSFVVAVVVADAVVDVVVVVRSTEQRVLSSNNSEMNCHCKTTPEAGQLLFAFFFFQKKSFENENFQ